MKKTLLLAAACLVASLAQAAPVPSGQWQHSLTVRPSNYNPPQQGNTTYNPRYFDGEIYATEISGPTYRCFGRFDSNTGQFLGGGIPAVNEHRMIGRLRGPGGSTYVMGTGGDNGSATLIPTFTRYDFDYSASNPVALNSIDSQVVESFDWVDDDTMISTCYVSGQRKKLYLTDVTANPFGLTKNTTWNANGYVENTALTTRIRNVRVGQIYSGYAYYGDAGQNTNPKFYAIDLATGASTLLGNLGTLTGGGSFGLWTVVERGGYLYVQTTDNGILVYNMTSATVLGSLYTTYTKAELDAATGLATTDQYYGMDLSPDGTKMLLGAAFGNVYQLQAHVPIASGQWQLRATIRPSADNPPQQGSSTYNPRYFDGEIYATQISGDTFRCFGHYLSGVATFLGGAIPPINEHRMLGRLRNPAGSPYFMATGGAIGPALTTFATTFTRYDSDYYASNPVAVNSIDDQVVESYDWVDDDTMISTCYVSGQRKKLYLTDVTADPFGLTKNIAWNANGYVENTLLTTRIRNVRVGQMYSGYAYYGDAGQNTNPKFYAINLANGVSTLLGGLGTLTGSGSFGLWTVVERGGYLYVQTTDNGILVYNMVDATTLGSLSTTYTKAELDAATRINTTDQYYGLDVSTDGKKILLGAPLGNVYELEPAFGLSISRSGTNVVLSWSAFHTGAVVESSSSLETSFTELTPQPVVTAVGDLNVAVIPIDPAVPAFFRLRK